MLFTWCTETIFWVLLQWLTLVTSLTVVSTGKTVVQVTNREDTPSSNCPPTASGRWSPLSMLSNPCNKINNKLYMYLLNDHEQMNGRNDSKMDKKYLVIATSYKNFEMPRGFFYQFLMWYLIYNSHIKLDLWINYLGYTFRLCYNLSSFVVYPHAHQS